MRSIGRRAAPGLLALVGVALAGAAVIGPDKPSTQPLGPAGSALSTTDADSAEPESATDDRTVITLGDLEPPTGPPFPPALIDDPCTVVSRDDLPMEARPDENPVTTPEPPADERTGCRLDYRRGPGPVALTITIRWVATAPGPLDPARHPGAKAATFAGRPGLVREVTGQQGEVVCLGLMPAGMGTATARVSNTRYPTVHPCTMATAVLSAITRKTS